MQLAGAISESAAGGLKTRPYGGWVEWEGDCHVAAVMAAPRNDVEIFTSQ